MADAKDEYLTVADLAARWKVSEPTARRRVDQYGLNLTPTFRPRRIPVARYDAFVASGGTNEVPDEPAKKRIGRPARNRPVIDTSNLKGLRPKR